MIQEITRPHFLKLKEKLTSDYLLASYKQTHKRSRLNLPITRLIRPERVCASVTDAMFGCETENEVYSLQSEGLKQHIHPNSPSDPALSLLWWQVIKGLAFWSFCSPGRLYPPLAPPFISPTGHITVVCIYSSDQEALCPQRLQKLPFRSTLVMNNPETSAASSAKNKSEHLLDTQPGPEEKYHSEFHIIYSLYALNTYIKHMLRLFLPSYLTKNMKYYQ